MYYTNTFHGPTSCCLFLIRVLTLENSFCPSLQRMQWQRKYGMMPSCKIVLGKLVLGHRHDDVQPFLFKNFFTQQVNSIRQQLILFLPQTVIRSFIISLCVCVRAIRTAIIYIWLCATDEFTFRITCIEAHASIYRH